MLMAHVLTDMIDGNNNEAGLGNDGNAAGNGAGAGSSNGDGK